MSLNIDSSYDGKYTSKEAEGNYKSSLGLVLFECMKKHSNRIFQYVADTDETDTFGQVLTRSVRAALKLQEKGIKKNDIISTCTYNQRNSCIPFVASQFLGAIPANFDPNLSHIDTIYLLKLVEPKIIFVSTESLPFMEKCLKESEVKSELVVFGYSKEYSEFSEYLEPNPEEENFKPVPVDDSKETALILFSSGTTGYPKGICLNHYSLLRHVNKDLFKLDQVCEETVLLGYSTFYWISAVWFFLRAVGKGDSLIVCSKFDPFDAWRIIEKYKVTAIFAAPYLAKALIENRLSDVDVSSLQMFMTGSTAVTKALIDGITEALPKVKVVHGYGQTESTALISFFDGSNLEYMNMQLRKPSSCGKIVTDFLWKVVDPTTEKILGPNERGELRIKSDFLMNGYYKMDSSSAFDSEGYLRTGDIVYYDEEDCLFVVDRIKEMFKYKGWHILPAILEEVLMSHPAVKDAVVVGIPHDTDGEHPMGIVVLYDEYKHVEPKDIEVFVEQKVPEIQRLRAGVKVAKEILRTTTAKLRRGAMRKMVLNGEI